MTEIEQTPASHPSPDGQLVLYTDGAATLRVRIDGATVWLTQRQMSDLYQIGVPTVNEHLAGIYEEAELDPAPTIRKYRIVQVEGTRRVQRLVDHYSLDAVLAVGYRVRSARGVQFRQWATHQLRELLQKGFVLDDERVAAGRSIGQDYFDELLERIRAIRLSERVSYQQITDLFAQTSIDYDKNSTTARDFYAKVQNKLHWAIHGHTAPELIRERADAGQPNMGLHTWKNAPHGRIRKADVTVAKNYLNAEELAELRRVVSMYLDYAEDQARRHVPMHMADWAKKLDGFLQFNERNILTHAGQITREVADEHAHAEFGKFESSRRHIEATTPTSDFDKLVAQTAKAKPTIDTKSGRQTPPKRTGDAN